MVVVVVITIDGPLLVVTVQTNLIVRVLYVLPPSLPPSLQASTITVRTRPPAWDSATASPSSYSCSHPRCSCWWCSQPVRCDWWMEPRGGTAAPCGVRAARGRATVMCTLGCYKPVYSRPSTSPSIAAVVRCSHCCWSSCCPFVRYLPTSTSLITLPIYLLDHSTYLYLLDHSTYLPT